MWELPSDGIMILFNNEHNRFMIRMLSPFFHESTRGFGVVLVVLVDVGLNPRKLGEIDSVYLSFPLSLSVSLSLSRFLSLIWGIVFDFGAS